MVLGARTGLEKREKVTGPRKVLSEPAELKKKAWGVKVKYKKNPRTKKKYDREFRRYFRLDPAKDWLRVEKIGDFHTELRVATIKNLPGE